MKIEKNLVALSVIALVLGIIMVVPIALMPSAAEPPPPRMQIMIPEEFHALYGTNATDVPEHVIVHATGPSYYYGEDGFPIPVEEFYIVYDANVTMSTRMFFFPVSEPGE